jgi:hypothetical protein
MAIKIVRSILGQFEKRSRQKALQERVFWQVNLNRKILFIE